MFGKNFCSEFEKTGGRNFCPQFSMAVIISQKALAAFMLCSGQVEPWMAESFLLEWA